MKRTTKKQNNNSIYFHLIGGAAGDMLLNSCIGLGCPLAYLKKELQKLPIKFSIAQRSQKQFACHVPVTHLEFAGPRFTLPEEVAGVISRSRLSDTIKIRALAVYERIKMVEQRVHRNARVHYHHLGEIDALLEICGFFIALDYLAVGAVYVSPFPIARPAPAVLQLIAGKPMRTCDWDYESVTPTAAALLFDAKPFSGEFSFSKSALSFGSRQDDYLAAYILCPQYDEDTIIRIEANIDDMNPQCFEQIFDELLGQGAKDVYLEQIIMKKSRPAFVLNVLCAPADRLKLEHSIFTHTTTFGVRYAAYARDKLAYAQISKKTKFGVIRFRVACGVGITKETPEYADCLAAARKFKIPLADVYTSL